MQVQCLRRYDPADWATKNMRALLVLAGHDPRSAVERQQLQDMCEDVLAATPSQLQLVPPMADSMDPAGGTIQRAGEAVAAACFALPAAVEYKSACMIQHL